jgi:predicted alpha-1,6-mannanase (GH76 family)
VPGSHTDDASAWAAEAERSVGTLFGQRFLRMPGTHLARVRHPSSGLLDRPWHYWWQAHYIDALVDAAMRALGSSDPPGARSRADRADQLLLTVRLRNLSRLTNRFYDDMAWLALAVDRLDGLHGLLAGRWPRRRLRRAERVLTAQLRSAVTEDLGGGAFWDRSRDFKNVPSSGPVALHLARVGDRSQATALVEWMYARLFLEERGLFADGIRVVSGEERLVGDVYSYNQGTVLGTLVTLGDPINLSRAARLISAISDGLTVQWNGRRPLVTHGLGDGGLFTGILVRYLALAAKDDALEPSARASAAALVSDTAKGLWEGRAGRTVHGEQVSVFPSAPTEFARGECRLELSTQLQAWTVLEASASLQSAPQKL